MKRINTSPLSGMQELLPSSQAVFDKLKANIADVFHRHGFQSIETPVIDRTEVLLSKAGGDTEKQIYRVVKTEEAVEESDQALRFDHTVPLARYVVEHENDLAFPFHVTQIGRNYRGERAQKGRFREFYQCDVDIVGRGSLPVAYDAKAIAAIYDALKTIKLPGMKVRISNRKVLAGFLEALGLSSKTTEISNVIDHAEKVPMDETRNALTALGLDEKNVQNVITFVGANGSPDEVEAKLKTALSDLTLVGEGLKELRIVYDLLATMGMRESITIDLMIVRGLDYYTGTVYEIVLPEYRSIGSISGGGRYDNLASNFTDQKLPGVGGSIGLTRLFYALNAAGLLENVVTNPVDYCIVPISEKEYAYAMNLADKISAEGKSVDVVLLDKKLGDKMAYAGKIAKYAVVIGEEEVATGEVKRKDLTTGIITPLKVK
ncbi:MAG: histidine--tRNA ligase [Candidatus Nomurabacteria bacterium]|jgi:histidyl-tRNA synthetase|nr:histidine--tRNA ligase [Candidatus Nomurabacteria bacterium]